MNHEDAKNTKKNVGAGSPRPNSGSPRPNSRSPRPNSGSPRPNSGYPRPNSGSPRPNSGSPRPPKPQSPIPSLDDWLEIGKVVAPQGLSGELRIYPNTDFPERFEEPGKRWLLRPGETELEVVELLHGRYLENKNLYVIKLKGVSDRHQAENMRDCRFFVPVSDRPELAEGEFHVLDLLGLPVFMQSSGEFVGTVVDILPSGHDLLEVKFDPDFVTNHEEFKTDKEQKTVLIPFVMEIVPVVDLATRRVEITPPPGLLSVND